MDPQPAQADTKPMARYENRSSDKYLILPARATGGSVSSSGVCQCFVNHAAIENGGSRAHEVSGGDIRDNSTTLSPPFEGLRVSS